MGGSSPWVGLVGGRGPWVGLVGGPGPWVGLVGGPGPWVGLVGGWSPAFCLWIWYVSGPTGWKVVRTSSSVLVPWLLPMGGRGP